MEKLLQYDIFISYVVEDRELVEQFVRTLSQKGYRVWYARREFQAGNDILDVVKEGLKVSRYGIAIISPNYIGHWAYGELFALLDKKDKFIPILHNISMDDAAKVHPAITRWWAPSTSLGVNVVLDDISRRVDVKSNPYYFFAHKLWQVKKKSKHIFFYSSLLLVAFLFSVIYRNYISKFPDESFIENTLIQRISDVESNAGAEFHRSIFNSFAKKSSLEDIDSYNKQFFGNDFIVNRNRYHFTNGIENIQSVTALKDIGILPSVEHLEPPFGIRNFELYLSDTEETDKYLTLKYVLVNTSPLQSDVTASSLKTDALFEIDVSYTEPVRFLEVVLTKDLQNNKNYRVVKLIGVKPKETFMLEKRIGGWFLLHIR